MVLECFICLTCGTQFGLAEREPDQCPICRDERQYVGHADQEWTTLAALQRTHRNVICEEELGLYSIQPEPRCGIGQRAFLVRTPAGNLLWDCVPLIDPNSVSQIKSLGGVTAIAISHPHYYSSMVEWSQAFGDVPVVLNRRDSRWVMRASPSLKYWDGDEHLLFGDLSLIRTGGHFDGFQVLLWRAGAEGRGVLLAGDQPFVCQDRRWVSFMYSYPNLIPLAPRAVRCIENQLTALQFDRCYGAFQWQRIATDARGAIKRSASRYLQAVRDEVSRDDA